MQLDSLQTIFLISKSASVLLSVGKKCMTLPLNQGTSCSWYRFILNHIRMTISLSIKKKTFFRGEAGVVACVQCSQCSQCSILFAFFAICPTLSSDEMKGQSWCELYLALCTSICSRYKPSIKSLFWSHCYQCNQSNLGDYTPWT